MLNVFLLYKIRTRITRIFKPLFMSNLLHEELTKSILKVFYDVYNELGYGFLERVYQNSLYHELKSNRFKVETQKRIKVYYKEIEVGEYIADIIVNDFIILELKAQEYLKATHCEVGLLLNFGKKPEFIRKVYQNFKKIKSALSAFKKTQNGLTRPT